MPFGIGLPEILIFLVVVLLLFGAKRVPEIGRSMGRGMREFKDAVTNADDDEKFASPTPAPPAELPSAPSEPLFSPHDEKEAEEAERETVR